MKYRVIKEFMPDVIVGQIIERENDHMFIVRCITGITSRECHNEICLGYIKDHPEIFEPVEEKRNVEEIIEDAKKEVDKSIEYMKKSYNLIQEFLGSDNRL